MYLIDINLVQDITTSAHNSFTSKIFYIYNLVLVSYHPSDIGPVLYSISQKSLDT
jgi:hypothetical protein